MELELLKSESAAALARVGAADEGAGFLIDENRVRAAEAFRIAADNLMTAANQIVLNRLGDARFQSYFGRLDMIEARRRNRFLGRHAEVDQIG